ncbi:hypothetical protein SEA_RUCHI_28 [Arthrobacter phage Ruchi]|nr:hypothetical protein SEA_BASILISK_29 [Arthrobacter phage Basilisk]WNM69476.1 hypothetical protein SEA_RUCHI_28 [Arthrobacter phage Ruchi]
MTQTKKQQRQAELDAIHDEEPCPHGQRAGIVTNQPDGYDHNRAHASVAVCGNPTCRARALGWVYRLTGEHGTYVSDSSKRP